MKKKFYLYLIIIYNILLSSKLVKSSITKFKPLEVEEGIYNIISKKRYSVLTYLEGLRTAKAKYGHSRVNFKFINSNNNNTNIFFIQHLYSGLYIGVKEDINKNVAQLQIIVKEESELEKNNICKECFEWEFLKENNKENSFYIKNNKLKCILKEYKYKFICSKTDENLSNFSLLKIYQENDNFDMSEEDQKILDQEPIDVVIKYIDLNDPELKRNNLIQITKDEEHEEIKYCIRSILTNIPWIRKIFILMPNEKVRFFKNYTDINEKIIYVRDKDILGYDSSNVHAFQYRIWKLSEYGLSKNFISMDDDYFIGKPMKKSDFFYVENKNVVPYIISTSYQIETYETSLKQSEELKKKIESKNARTQSSDEFMYTVYRTYLFLTKYFDSPIIVPGFTHNAIPVSINDLKELFYIVDNNTEYRYHTLYCLYRNKFSIQYQTSILVYTINKYNRKVNKIKNNYIDSANTLSGDYNYPLFCINTGNNKDYSEFSFMSMKAVLEKLFPTPTKYEIYDPTNLALNSFNVIKKLENDFNKLTEEKEKEDLEVEKYRNEKINKMYYKYIEKIRFFKIEKSAYDLKMIKYQEQIKDCLNSYDINEKKLANKKIKNYFDNSSINDIKIENNNIEVRINEYMNEIEDLKNKTSYIEHREKRIYLIIDIQLIIIIVIIPVIIFLYKRKKVKKINSEYSGYRNLIS
jgi:hypothetical protein